MRRDFLSFKTVVYSRRTFMNTEYLIQYVSYGLHTIVRTWDHPVQEEQEPKTFCRRKDLADSYFTPKELCRFLNEQEKNGSYHSLPVLFSVKRKVCYAYVPSSKKDFLVGPVRFSSPLLLNRNTDNVNLPEEELRAVPECDFSDFASYVLLVYNLLHTSFLSIDDLVTANCMDESMEDTIMENFSALVFDRHEQDLPHNPYDQEFREFSSIEQGNIEMLKKSLQEDYTGKIGTLAKDEVRNMRNRGIVVITLASRAAIRGGLLPEVAFSMSDVFIQKLEEESDTAILLNMMHQFEFKFAEMVADLNSQKAGRPKKDQNPLIDRCKDYIFKHLHEKIRIQNIADELFLNANYLSEIFRRHEGLTITEFILREKVNLTKNLLAYSPYSYSEIAAYLGFSSQSHLGKVFKKHTGMTLHQYRNQYGVKEF